MDEIRTRHIRSEENRADIATKVIPGGLKHDHLIAKLLYDITDEHDGQEKADTPHSLSIMASEFEGYLGSLCPSGHKSYFQQARMQVLFACDETKIKQ
jgi:hypothetical protein